MLRGHQTFLIVVLSIVAGLALLCKESQAQPPIIEKLNYTPLMPEVPAGSGQISLQVIAKGKEPLHYMWTLEGTGELKGPVDGFTVIYMPPKTIDEASTKATITVTVTDSTGKQVSKNQSFTVRRPQKTSTTSRFFTLKNIAIVAGSATLIGGGVALCCTDRDNGESSIEITSPVAHSQVDWITNVYGTAKHFESGDYVKIYIQPYGYEEYLQSTIGTIETNGNWTAPGCYFGLQGTVDIGHQFRVRAELVNGAGQAKASVTVENLTRR